MTINTNAITLNLKTELDTYLTNNREFLLTKLLENYKRFDRKLKHMSTILYPTISNILKLCSKSNFFTREESLELKKGIDSIFNRTSEHFKEDNVNTFLSICIITIQSIDSKISNDELTNIIKSFTKSQDENLLLN